MRPWHSSMGCFLNHEVCITTCLHSEMQIHPRFAGTKGLSMQPWARTYLKPRAHGLPAVGLRQALLTPWGQTCTGATGIPSHSATANPGWVWLGFQETKRINTKAMVLQEIERVGMSGHWEVSVFHPVFSLMWLGCWRDKSTNFVQ